MLLIKHCILYSLESSSDIVDSGSSCKQDQFVHGSGNLHISGEYHPCDLQNRDCVTLDGEEKPTCAAENRSLDSLLDPSAVVQPQPRDVAVSSDESEFDYSCFTAGVSSKIDVQEDLANGSGRPRRKAAAVSLQRTRSFARFMYEEQNQKKKKHTADDDFDAHKFLQTEFGDTIQGEDVGDDLHRIETDSSSSEDLTSDEDYLSVSDKNDKKSSNNTGENKNEKTRSWHKCDICGRGSRGILSYYKHMYEKHGVIPDDATLLSCELCQFTSFDEKVVSSHYIARHPGTEGLVQCPDCDQMFSRLFISVHKRRTHGIGTTSIKPFFCDQCGQTFSKKYGFKHHVSQVHEHAAVVKKDCPVVGCDKKQISEVHIRQHIVRCHGDKKYDCTQEGCTKRFAAVHNLRVHMLQHSGVHPFTCKLCDYSARQKVCLKLHMKNKHQADDLEGNVLPSDANMTK